MKDRAVGPVDGPVDRHDHRLKAVAVVGAPDDFSFDRVGQRVACRVGLQRDVVGDDIGIARREALEQSAALVAVELPADDGSGLGHGLKMASGGIGS